MLIVQVTVVVPLHVPRLVTADRRLAFAGGVSVTVTLLAAVAPVPLLTVIV